MASVYPPGLAPTVSDVTIPPGQLFLRGLAQTRAVTTWDISTRLLSRQNRNLAEHTVLRENVATYLTQLKPEFLEQLQTQPEDTWQRSLTCAYAHGPVDMVQKLSRDLAQKPYDDAAVSARLEQLQSELQEKMQTIREGNGDYPCRFYLAGSVVKGRFGANSDLDLICQASPEWSKTHYRHAFDDVSVQYFQGDPAYLASFAPTVEVTGPDLRLIYQQGLEARGYALDDGHLVAQRTIRREVEVPPQNGSINWSAATMC